MKSSFFTQVRKNFKILDVHFEVAFYKVYN